MCISPFKKKDSELSFPCGRCVDCKKRRVSGWSFRLLKEAERASSAFFLTITYNQEFVPFTDKMYMSLNKPSKDKKGRYISSHLQLFFKRLRKLQKQQIKYYACGEYGGKTMRPHYHVIIFNCELANLIGEDYTYQVNLGNVKLDGTQNFHCESWIDVETGKPLGYISVGQLTEASAAYTLKYISKEARIPVHKNDDRVPEYSIMSKGLGSNYLTKNMKKWHKNDLLNRMYVPLKNGQKIAMPRYYKEKLYTKVDRELINYHIDKERLKESQNMTDEEIKNSEYVREAKAAKNNDTRNEKI